MTLENFSLIDVSRPAARRSRQARVVWGSRVVTIGGDAPVRVQSMTNTDTVDVIGTAIQVKELAQAGSELVRITVNTPEAASRAAHPRTTRPHGHRRASGRRLSLQRPPPAHRGALPAPRPCPSTASTPATWARATSATSQFGQMIEAALRHDKPVRIGVNWGSLDQELLAS
jgi:(E)-4-hydroxy-3-methylbut-2-enyl-diphosphate synthase